MAGTPLVFVGRYRIPTGGEEEFGQTNSEMAEFVEAKEPRLLAFASYRSENGREATTIQVHPDSESLSYHLQVAASRISRGVQMVEVITIDLYGDVDAMLVERLRAMGIPVATWSPLSGFSRA